MKAVKLSPTQHRALAKLSADPQSAYTLRERLPTLEALAKAGYARKITPRGAGGIFSPTTHYKWVRATPVPAVQGALGKLEAACGVEHLRRPVKVHICKDRTLTARLPGQPVFNGVAIPVFSVDTPEQAEALFTLVGSNQWLEHPLLPGKVWRKLYNGVAGDRPHLELADLPEVTAYLAERYQLLRSAEPAQ